MTLRGLVVTGGERHADIAVLRARQCQQAFRQSAFEPLVLDFSAAAILIRQPRFRQQFAQVEITALVFHQQQQTRRLVAICWIGDPYVAAGDGFYALAARFLVEPDEAESIAEIGQCERALTVFGSGFNDVVKAHDAVGNREFGVNTKMDKTGI